MIVVILSIVLIITIIITIIIIIIIITNQTVLSVSIREVGSSENLPMYIQRAVQYKLL